MTPADFEYLRDLLYRRSGLALGVDKRYLAESRLSILCRRQDIEGLDQLIARVRGQRDERLTGLVVEAMTTNETLFFRDRTPFELFRNVILPEIGARRDLGPVVRIWSAACSTGQEAYSLAMILDETANQIPGRRFEIIGTDISQEVIDKAREGSYSQFEVQRGLPVQMLVKHFSQVGEQWRICDRLRQMARFQLFNLLDDPSPLGRFDIIFCRNVMIYFDLATKAKVIKSLSRQLNPGGVVIMGAAETALGVSEALVPDRLNRGLYRLPGQDTARKPAAAWAMREPRRA